MATQSNDAVRDGRQPVAGEEEARLRHEHPDLEIRRVILEQDLKREYQEFLQNHNRNRPDSDGRLGRDDAATTTRSVTGRANTICRTRTTRCTLLTTNRVGGRWPGTSPGRRPVHAHYLALTPPAARGPASASPSSPLAVPMLAPGRIRVGWRSPVTRISSQQTAEQRQHQPSRRHSTRHIICTRC